MQIAKIQPLAEIGRWYQRSPQRINQYDDFLSFVPKKTSSKVQ